MEQNKIKSTIVKEINKDNNDNDSDENQRQENEDQLQIQEQEPIGEDYSDENEY